MLAALLAGTPGAPRKIKNMPHGWTWPPSAAMKEAGASCLKKLDEAAVEWQPAGPVKKVATPVEIPALTIAGIALVPLRANGRSTMDCHLAAAIAEVAPALHAIGVRSLHFRQLHKYRTVRKRGRSTKILSRHAIGLAVDVFEVGFEDGAVLRVDEWSRAGRRLAPVAAVFAESEAFRTPLTPDNDPRDHGDHVHLEAHMHL